MPDILFIVIETIWKQQSAYPFSTNDGYCFRNSPSIMSSVVFPGLQNHDQSPRTVINPHLLSYHRMCYLHQELCLRLLGTTPIFRITLPWSNDHLRLKFIVKIQCYIRIAFINMLLVY